MAGKINLLDLDQRGLADFLATLGEKSYRAVQLLKWIHYFGCADFAAMTNLSKTLRAQLADCATIHLPKIVFDKQSADGTRKWLLQLDCGNCIETVFIPESGRGTLCVSSQVGCGLNCRFCSTATQGFNRNLSVAEIIGQVWLAVRKLSTEQGTHDRQVTNVVMMGMGEPLLNFDAVVSAMDVMLDDHAYGLSKRRVTLSTSGLVPQMERLAQQSPVALAVSLHAPTNELRDILVPINKKYPLEQLMGVCRTYYKAEPKRRITFEYVMLAGVNDSLTHAKQLVRLLQGIPAKLNLIPFNPFPGTIYETSKLTDILAFRDFMVRAGMATTVRKTRGDDIDAACGQLVGSFQDKTKRSQRWQRMVSAQEDVA